jgi:uncharacterized protein with PhoU and TrkA domain
MHIAAATEVISDAALEISEGVLRGLGTHPVIEEAVLESDEVIVRTTVAPGSDLDGTTLGAADVKTETGMRVIAVHRGDLERHATPTGKEPDEWAVSPGPRTELYAGDTLIAKGTRAGGERLATLAGDSE